MEAEGACMDALPSTDFFALMLHGASYDLHRFSSADFSHFCTREYRKLTTW